MTELDEALRALEKKWREESCGPSDDGDEPAMEAGARLALLNCADELAALLTTRQEVAPVDPVAFAIELSDGNIGSLGWVDYRKFDLLQKIAITPVGARYVFAYRPSTGQTSDARDVVEEEVARAVRKFPTWPTDPLHAVAVLGEEFGELTKAVLQSVYEPHKVQPGEVRTEAVQTAAMALRFLKSLNVYEYDKSEQHAQETTR